MKLYFKKVGAMLISLAMILTVLPTGLFNNNIILATGGESLGILFGVSPIKQLPNWCWVTSTQMVLREKLKTEGKLNDGEYIHEQYGENCIEIANEYYSNAEYISDASDFKGKIKKSMQEFEKLYSEKVKYRTDGEGVDSALNKEAAFLVYLCSDRLESNDPFTTGDNGEQTVIATVVLKAVGLNNYNFYFVQIFSESKDNKMLLIHKMLSQSKMPLVTWNNGHFRVIVGLINNNKVLIQETNGETLQECDINEFNDEAMEFISDENIFDINLKLKKNCFKKNDGILILIDHTDTHNYCLENKNDGSIRLVEKLGMEDMVLVQRNVVTNGKAMQDSNMYMFYEAKEIDISDLENWVLKNEREIIQNSDNTKNSGNSGGSGGFSSSGSSGGSGSAGVLSSSSSSSSSVPRSVVEELVATATKAPVLVTYEYKSDETKPISAVQAIKNYIKPAVNLTKVVEIEKANEKTDKKTENKDNGAIVFKTNIYKKDNNNQDIASTKENQAVWTFELSKLDKNFVEKYEKAEELDKKVQTNQATQEDKIALEQVNTELKDYNFKLNVTMPKFENVGKDTSVLLSKATEVLKDSKSREGVKLVDFINNGKYPGEAVVDLNIGKDSANKQYLVYYVYVDPKTGKTTAMLIKQNDKPFVVTSNKDGYVRFRSDRGAGYILLPNTNENMANISQLQLSFDHAFSGN